MAEATETDGIYGGWLKKTSNATVLASYTVGAQCRFQARKPVDARSGDSSLQKFCHAKF